MLARTRRRRALLLAAPVLAAAAVTLGAAPPANACPNVVCATSDQDGSISAATSYVTITVSGGHYASKSGPISVPNRVPPPCYYIKGRSGAEMARDSKDPYSQYIAVHTDTDKKTMFPPDTMEHATEDGNWWSWMCDSANFDGTIKEFFDYVDEWAADHDTVWVPAGQEPPQPPVPPEILMGIARQVMDDAVQMPVVHFNPAERAFVRLETWMWLDPGGYEPVSVTAAGGGNSVTVTATPRAVSVGGLPTGSATETACAAGGRPYAEGGTTDCSITFGQSSGTQPGQKWPFQVALTWDVTATGAALQGPPTITRAEDEALTVLESQSVNATPTN